MQTIENENELIETKTMENPAPVQTGNYEPVRYNAMKHGILSKLVVLPHEDQSEFSELLTGLIDEHRKRLTRPPTQT